MSPKELEPAFPWLNKRLHQLDPPVLDRSSPFKRFTAELHMINYYFWSTEIAYASLLWSQSSHQDSSLPAHQTLAACAASAFKRRVGSTKPHYTGSMGSLIVQVRWNYDRLARQAILEAHAALERLAIAQAAPLVGKKAAKGPFHELRQALAIKGAHLDPLLTYRVQLYRELRNNLVHDSSTIHSFPSPAFIRRTQAIRAYALPWRTGPAWPDEMTNAFNELMWTTKHLSEGYDLPQLFFIAVFGLARFREFGEHLRSKCP